MRIDLGKFEEGHELFLSYMKTNSKNGADFEGFDHAFIQSDEVKYKRAVEKKGSAALNLNKWKKWKEETGKILEAVREACRHHENLLGQSGRKYGLKDGAESPLYRVKTEDQIRELENGLYNFFLGGNHEKSNFGRRFDSFCEYLKKNSLGCKWPFVAYLAFLMNSKLYFPVSPDKFDALLKYYDIDKTIGRKIFWYNYLILIEVADELKVLLRDRGYGDADAIEIQSYMYVVGYLDKETSIEDKTKSISLAGKIRKAKRKAENNERTGWTGEEIVENGEKEKLIALGLKEYAKKVKRVSRESDSFGYDVLSFDEEGNEIHIEVKTTEASEENDPGFWLSEWEREVAEKDNRWVLYRVYLSDKQSKIVKLGNLLRNPVDGWEKQVSSWHFIKQ